MVATFTRRTFLSGCAVAGVGALSGAIEARGEPIKRIGSPKFKFSLAAYSYRRLLSGESPQLTLADFIDDCAKMNLEGTELTSYYFPQPVTREYLLSLKQQCFRLGLDISGTAVGNDFGHPPGEKREQQIQMTKQWIEHAAVLGAPVIRVFAGRVKKGSTPEQAHSLMVSGLQECCEYAAEHGVFLALENHGGPTSTPEGILALVRDVKSPWFGVNLDTGNFHTKDPYGDLAKIAPYALNVQVKVVVNHQPTDFARLAKILREANYRGYIVLEYEESGNPRTECPAYMLKLRTMFA